MKKTFCIVNNLAERSCISCHCGYIEDNVVKKNNDNACVELTFIKIFIFKILKSENQHEVLRLLDTTVCPLKLLVKCEKWSNLISQIS